MHPCRTRTRSWQGRAEITLSPGATINDDPRADAVTNPANGSGLDFLP
jgi:hypothetical protein